MIDDEILDIRQKLLADFEYYAPRCLFIRPEVGGVVPFSMNATQKYIHSKLEEQKKEKGYVRAIILKGRQQGCSTYIAGRYYWLTSQSMGKQAFILTHQQQATDNIFGIVQRYHDNCPGIMRPSTSASSSKELYFNYLDSGYKVGTAGAKGVGRSATIQYLHGSEVAFWPHAEEHAAGIMNAIPNVEGTEIILESTANSIGNYFHRQWELAKAGKSEFIAIFAPCYIHEANQIKAPEQMFLSEYEEHIKQQYKLSDNQLFWRRQTIAKFEGVGGDILFQQEYPFTEQEAFQVSSQNSFISADIVIKALKNSHLNDESDRPLVMGIDPASVGNDHTGIVIRQGLNIVGLSRVKIGNTMALVRHIANLIDEYRPTACFIDNGTFGAAIVDRLLELDYSCVIGVNFGSKAEEHGRFKNTRCEIWNRMRDWLQKPVSFPQQAISDIIGGELMVPTYEYTSDNILKLESKESMKKRGFDSPDLADALALTFTYNLEHTSHRQQYRGGVQYDRVNQGDI